MALFAFSLKFLWKPHREDTGYGHGFGFAPTNLQFIEVLMPLPILCHAGRTGKGCRIWALHLPMAFA